MTLFCVQIRPFISVLFLCYFAFQSDGRNLLLIGDSVDRRSVDVWCEHGGKFGEIKGLLNVKRYDHYLHYMKRWGEDIIKTEFFGHPDNTLYCQNEANDSVAWVSVYGSRSSGPVHHGDRISPPADPLIQTPNRVKAAIQIYLESFGVPDSVVFHTILWDSAYYLDNLPGDWSHYSALYNKTLAIFKSDTMERVEEIRKLLPATVDIGIRTAVMWSPEVQHVVDGFNDIMRDLSMEQNLTLYDFDKDVWSVYGFDRSDVYVREVFPSAPSDLIHPYLMYCLRATDKMLGRMYSAWYFYKGTDKPKPPDFLSSPTMLNHKHFWIRLLSETNSSQVFYSEYLNEARHRWGPIDEATIFKMRLGPGDIFYYQPSSQHPLPYESKFPIGLLDGNVKFIETTSGDVFFISEDNVAHQATPLLSRYAPSFIPNITQSWVCILYCESSFPHINILEDGSVFRLEWEKQVYYTNCSQKHRIPNVYTFEKYGLLWGNIVILNSVLDLQLFHLMPIGDDLF